MHEFRYSLRAFMALALFLFGIASVSSANVQHLTLKELVARADRIVRGTVIDQDDTMVTAGGGSLPATLYRITVAEALKGAVKAGDTIEVRLLARPKVAAASQFRRGTLLQDLPEFETGREYLFILTRPSAVGLSTTVGLRQGLFELRGRSNEALAVNGANNLGLFGEPAAAARTRTAQTARPGGPGPLPYVTLANEIRALAK